MNSDRSRGLDALARQVDDLRRELEGVRNTVDANIDTVTRLFEEGEGPDGRRGPIPELREAVEEVRGHLRELADRITVLTDNPTERPRLPSWADMPAEQASAAWNRLVRWMQTILFVRYPQSTETVKPCWYRHPELVEQLSWLHVSWVLAFHNPKASISTAAEWHTRWLPFVLTRTREILKPCYIEHVDDSHVETDRAFGQNFVAFVRADLARRASSQRGRPQR